MKRIITGLFIAAGWLAILYAQSFFLFWLVICGLSLIAAYEYFSICFKHEGREFLWPFISVTLLPLFVTYFKRPDLVYALLVFSLLYNTVLTVFIASRLTKPFELLLKTCFGSVYIGLFTACLALIMAQPCGASWLLFLTAITAASDTGAYFLGKTFGKRKLCPSISPNKTVEGFLGGLLCGTAGALLVAFLLFDGVNTAQLASAAILLSALGVVGDLVESLLKRSMDVKDAGSILPGHGGILDRIDSLLLTAPVMYYLLSFNLLG